MASLVRCDRCSVEMDQDDEGRALLCFKDGVSGVPDRLIDVCKECREDVISFTKHKPDPLEEEKGQHTLEWRDSAWKCTRCYSRFKML